MTSITAERLLDWLAYHELPLQIFREAEDDLWVVVDSSANGVIGSGTTPHAALLAAYEEKKDGR